MIFAGIIINNVTSGDNTPPSTPSGLSLSNNGTYIRVTWNASTDNVSVTGYALDKKVGSGFWGLVSGNTTTTLYDDYDVSSGTTYTYRVRSYDAAGNFSGYSNEASLTL
jgi:hypothetical protein